MQVELPKAHFGFPGPGRDELLRRILAGRKTATTSLMVDFQVCGEPLPKVGDRSALVDSDDEPVAVLVTTDVRVTRLGDVDLRHVMDEAEGFEDVTSWRAAHQKFWHSEQMRQALGDPAFEVNDQTVVILERFAVESRKNVQTPDVAPAHRIALRPIEVTDQARLAVRGGPFDDFGPKQITDQPPPSALSGDGALAVTEDNDLLGSMSWHWVRWGPNDSSLSPMIGITILSQRRGRGIGTAAHQALVDLFFRHTAVNRIQAHTDVDNHIEQHVLEKVGFVREGITRGAQWRDGRYRDGWLYSILRPDWEARRAEPEHDAAAQPEQDPAQPTETEPST